MNDNNSQHYTIHDLSALSGLSNTLGSMTNEEMKKELMNRKKSVEAQKKIVNNFKSDLQNNSSSNIDINLDLIQPSPYEQIVRLKDEIKNQNEKIKNLSKENKSLKKIIDDKDKLISEFEEVLLKSKEKHNKLQKINNALKEEMRILKNNGGINSKNNSNEIEILNLDKKREEINNNFNNIQIQVNNSMNKTINKSINKSLITNKNNNINIENEVDNEDNEKDKLIEQLNSQLVYIYNEYTNLSNTIQQMNVIISNKNNNDYNELKIKYDELLKEKEKIK